MAFLFPILTIGKIRKFLIWGHPLVYYKLGKALLTGHYALEAEHEA
jgi:hypothetical protein